MNPGLPWWFIPAVIFGLIGLLALLLTISTPTRAQRRKDTTS